MPTVRNARGADLYAAKGEDGIAIPIQSKALSKKVPVPLGSDLSKLRTHWWVITIYANTLSPICYVMTLNEVKAAAHRGESAAGTTYWLQSKSYARPEYLEAWHRLGDPAAPNPN